MGWFLFSYNRAIAQPKSLRWKAQVLKALLLDFPFIYVWIFIYFFIFIFLRFLVNFLIHKPISIINGPTILKLPYFLLFNLNYIIILKVLLISKT